jgi:SAM-dependent methyltransferase
VATLDLSRIEEVDVAWRRGPLHEAVPAEWHGTFDACIASHVIEHLPDPVGFFESLDRLLAPLGVVSLVIPDKRFCFDFFKPLSTVGGLLEAHRRSSAQHSAQIRFDFEAYNITSQGELLWGTRPVSDIAFWKTLADAKHAFDTHPASSDDAYVDCHAWHFTPSSFALAVLELGALEVVDFSIDRAFPREGFEFYVTLHRGRYVPETQGELDARRLELLRQTFAEIREQTEMLDGGSDLSDSQGNTRLGPSAEQRCAQELERQLSLVLSSESWRLTAPVRIMGRHLRRLATRL